MTGRKKTIVQEEAESAFKVPGLEAEDSESNFVRVRLGKHRVGIYDAEDGGRYVRAFFLLLLIIAAVVTVIALVRPS